MPTVSEVVSGKIKCATSPASSFLINVDDYGAVGDGVTDDTVAVNNAITAAQTAGAKDIFFPPGSYKVSLLFATYPTVVFVGDNASFVGSTEQIFQLGDVAPDWMMRQALVNGNFDVWQRNTTFTNVAGVYTADRWADGINFDGGTSPNIVRSRQQLNSGDIANAFYYYRINVDGAGTFGPAAQYAIVQKIENGTRYLCGTGKKVTVSFWARSSIVNKRLGLRTVMRYGSGGTPSTAESLPGTTFTLTSNWTKYTATFTTNTLNGKTFGTNNDDTFDITIAEAWNTTLAPFYGVTTIETFIGAGNIDIAQVQVCAGDKALPFEPRSFGDELAMCQRYYEKSYGYLSAPASTSSGAIGAQWKYAINTTDFYDSVIRFVTRKRTAPTVTLYGYNTGTAGKWNVAFTSTDVTVTADSVADSAFHVSGTGLVANTQYIGHWIADAEL